MPIIHSLTNSPLAYGIYSTNDMIPTLEAPGYLLQDYIDTLVGVTVGKAIWGVSEVFKREGFEIEQTKYIDAEIASAKERRLLWDIKFLPFLFDSQFDVVENGQLYYGMIAYGTLMNTLNMKHHFLFGDGAGAPNLINPDWCVAAEIIGANTEKDEQGNRIVTVNFQQKFLGNTPY